MTRNPLSNLHGASLGALSLGLGLLGLAFSLGVRTASEVDAAAPAPALAVPFAAPVATSPSASTPSAMAPRAGERPGFADVVEPATRAVVNIQSIKAPESRARDSRMPPDHWFFGPFGDSPRNRRPEDTLGSGVIVRSDGVILTNNHVVEDAKEVLVTLSDKRELRAKVVGTDPKTDLAVIRIEATDLPTLPLGHSDDLRVGDLVFAIGNPFSVGQSVTMGIVSATRRTGLGLTNGGYEDFIQTDAAINPGNSGGALIDGRGQLVGINTAIVSRGSLGNQGLGFAVPTEMAARVMDQILREGKVTRAQVGVIIQEPTAALARAMGIEGRGGAVVAEVLPQSPAASAGLSVGDVIVSLDGRPIESSDQFRLDVSSRRPGSTVRLGVLRDGKPREFGIALAELRDDAPRSFPAAQPEDDTSRWGLGIQDLTPALRERLELSARAEGAAIVEVDEGSPAERAGLRPGDVVVQLNRQPVTSAADFARLARAAGDDTALLLVLREGSQLFIALEP